MSTTTNGSSPTSGVSAPRTSPLAPRPSNSLGTPVRSRHASGRWALGVGLVIAGALLAAWLMAGSSDRTSVLAVSHDVAYGHVLSAADITTTDVLVDPQVHTIPAADVSRVLGQVATTTLVAGSLLSVEQLAAAAPPAPGQVLVPLPVPGNRLPEDGLVAGARILVVDTPTADADPPTTAPATIEATVVSVGPADLNGVSVVDVTVAAGDGPALAARSVTGRFALVILPAGAP
jgi:hypothetical protein